MLLIFLCACVWLLCSLFSVSFVVVDGQLCGTATVNAPATYSDDKLSAMSNSLFAGADIDPANNNSVSKKFLYFTMGHPVIVPDTFSSSLPIADWSLSFWFRHNAYSWTREGTHASIISNHPCNYYECYQGFLFSFSCDSFVPVLQYYDDIYEVDHAFLHRRHIWYHMTVVFSNSNLTLFLDGEYMNHFTNSNYQTYNVSTSHAFWINANEGTQGAFRGYIARVHFFDHALSVDEIYTDYSTDGDENSASLVMDINLEYNSADEQLIVDEDGNTIGYLGWTPETDLGDPLWDRLLLNGTVITKDTTAYVTTDDGFADDNTSNTSNTDSDEYYNLTGTGIDELSTSSSSAVGWCGSPIVDVDNSYRFEKSLAISNSLFSDADIDSNLSLSKKFLYFNGPGGDRVTVPDTFSSDLPIADWSFSFWFMHDNQDTTSGYSFIMSNRPCGCYQGLFFSFSCDGFVPLMQYYYNLYEVEHAFGDSPDTWYHMTVVFRNSNITMFLDGEYMNHFTNGNYQTYDVSTSHDFWIGGDASTTSQFKGYIARVHFFDHALTRQEIYTDYSTDDENSASLVMDINLEYNSNGEQLIVDEDGNTIGYLGSSTNADVSDPQWITLYWDLLNGTIIDDGFNSTEDGSGNGNTNNTASSVTVDVTATVTEDGGGFVDNDDEDDNTMLVVVVALCCAIFILLLVVAYQIYKRKLSEKYRDAGVMFDNGNNQNGHTFEGGEGLTQESGAGTIVYV